MTTIACTLNCMVADQFVTYSPSYMGGTKIWTARGSVWGAAGDAGMCLRFRDWTLGKAKRPKTEDPEEKDTARIEALELSPKGLFLYVGDSPRDVIQEPFYAIGSGAGYAVGALSMGATLEQALDVAAKWDSATRLPLTTIRLVEAARRKRG
jgi:hypothetical protein